MYCVVEDCVMLWVGGRPTRMLVWQPWPDRRSSQPSTADEHSRTWKNTPIRLRHRLWWNASSEVYCMIGTSVERF